MNEKARTAYKWMKYGDDVIPLWVADMDFPSAEPIVQALHHRIDHGIYGYTRPTQELRDVIRSRLKNPLRVGDQRTRRLFSSQVSWSV